MLLIKQYSSKNFNTTFISLHQGLELEPGGALLSVAWGWSREKQLAWLSTKDKKYIFKNTSKECWHVSPLFNLYTNRHLKNA